MPNPLQRQLSHESLSSHLLEVPSQLLKRHIQTLLTGCKKLSTSESSKTRLHKDHNESFPICPTTNWYLNLSKTKERNLKVKQLNKYEGKWKSNTKLKLYIRQKLAAFILTHIHAHHKDATQVHNHTTLINGLLTWSMASRHDTFRIRIHSNTHVASEYILAHETRHFASEHILADDTCMPTRTVKYMVAHEMTHTCMPVLAWSARKKNIRRKWHSHTRTLTRSHAHTLTRAHAHTLTLNCKYEWRSNTKHKLYTRQENVNGIRQWTNGNCFFQTCCHTSSMDKRQLCFYIRGPIVLSVLRSTSCCENSVTTQPDERTPRWQFCNEVWSAKNGHGPHAGNSDGSGH